MFSQWKGIVRGRNPSNDNELIKAIGEFNNIVSEEQCENYVKHATKNAIKCLTGINVFEYISFMGFILIFMVYILHLLSFQIRFN